MKLSVSEIRDFQEDEFNWFCRYVRRRVPRRFPDPSLSAGTFWHTLMADFVRHGDKAHALDLATEKMLQLRSDMLAFQASSEVLRDFNTQCNALISAFATYHDFVADEETILIEEPLEADLGAGEPTPGATPVTLVGTPDRVIRRASDATIWHVQYKTISDRTPIPVFVAMAERSLHELVYSYLIRTRFSLPASQYGGTILNVVRKLSMKALRERPESAFVQEFIPIREEEVDGALRDIRVLAERMEAIRLGRAHPVQNRQLDGGRFGNVLTPYWDVRRGLADLSDDSRFMDLPDRYAAPN